MEEPVKIGLALSGGGSRAMAFHLGCLRALHKHGILEKVSALSSVSGGSVIAAMYVYSDDTFDDFDAKVTTALKKGFMGGIARQTLFSSETLKILSTQLTAGMLARIGSLLSLLSPILSFIGVNEKPLRKFLIFIRAPLLRRASRTTAFERHFRKCYFGETRTHEVKRPNLEMVINATEMRTGTAFRFGSETTGSWQYGVLTGEAPLVAKAVTASAAFPALLPAYDEEMLFEKDGEISKHRVVVTDGGVYDNLGITPFLPGRSEAYSSHVYDVDFIISCDAGQGAPDGYGVPFSWSSRMLSTIGTIHRRTSVLSYALLHELSGSAKLKGFLLPYLGQQDSSFSNVPEDFVARESVADYPTDFSSMSDLDLELLTKRGEQVTNLLIQTYGSKLL